LTRCNKDISTYLEGFEVPYVMEYLSREILLKADTKFLFRESGRKSNSRLLKEQFARKGTLDAEDTVSIHDYCLLYKTWIRSLKEPLIDRETQKRLTDRILEVGPDFDDSRLRLMAMMLVLGGVTLETVCLIHCIFFLQQIVQLQAKNMMTAAALADIFVVVLFEIDSPQKDDTLDRKLQGLITFVEFLLLGGADIELQDALKNSNAVNQKKTARNRSDSRTSRYTRGSSEPILFEYRMREFDE